MCLCYTLLLSGVIVYYYWKKGPSCFSISFSKVMTLDTGRFFAASASKVREDTAPSAGDTSIAKRSIEASGKLVEFIANSSFEETAHVG